MNERQLRFVEEYRITPNATQAAIRAGYSKKTAYSIGQRLLKHVEVSKMLQQKSEESAQRVDITQDYVLKTIYDTVERCRVNGKSFQPHAILKGTDQLGKHLRMWGDDKGKDDSGGALEVHIHLYGAERPMKTINGHGDES